MYWLYDFRLYPSPYPFLLTSLPVTLTHSLTLVKIVDNTHLWNSSLYIFLQPRPVNILYLENIEKKFVLI